MCNVNVAASKDLGIGYLDTGAVSFWVVKSKIECENNAVLTNCHGSCSLDLKHKLVLNTEPVIYYQNANKTWYFLT